jgi:hypothetical protein
MEEDICNWLPEEIYCVIVDGQHIPVDEVEFLNIEESFDGRDSMTFNYKGKRHTSYIIKKHI